MKTRTLRPSRPAAPASRPLARTLRAPAGTESSRLEPIDPFERSFVAVVWIAIRPGQITRGCDEAEVQPSSPDSREDELPSERRRRKDRIQAIVGPKSGWRRSRVSGTSSIWP
jgi:hypothetical protein